MSKKKGDQFGMVYSSDPNFKFEPIPPTPQEEITAAKQKIRIHLDRLKGNRELTRISGFIGTEAALLDMGKALKTKCGVGGNVKDEEILLQGDHRDKVLAWLIDNGYSQTKKAGG